MNAPKVSILIPVYNGEQFLAECLDSVLAQDFEDMEILIADDGSTDGSPALVGRYASKDNRIRWWKNPRNLGLAANFNCCLKAARGEYIKYVLQDDKLLSSTAIREMAAALDADFTVSLVGTGSYILDETSRLLEHRNNFSRGACNGRQVILRCMENPANLIGEPSVVMFRRAMAIRGFDEGYKQLVDFEMWIHLLVQGDWFYLDSPHCAFRRHHAQQTQVNKRNRLADDENVKLLESFFDHPPLTKIITRKMLFSQIKTIRGRPHAAALCLQLKKKLGLGWYCLFWVNRKLTRPFQKLNRSWQNRMIKGHMNRSKSSQKPEP